MKFTDLQSFICISNDTNKQAQYNVNEKCDEDVEVDFTEDPCCSGCLHFLYFSVSVEQVISINYGIQALGSDSECFKLKKKRTRKHVTFYNAIAYLLSYSFLLSTKPRMFQRMNVIEGFILDKTLPVLQLYRGLSIHSVEISVF